jgi:hypothetical protein
MTEFGRESSSRIHAVKIGGSIFHTWFRAQYTSEESCSGDTRRRTP